MKGIEKFFKTHKKGCIIGGSVVLGIIVIFFTIFFIIPSFGNNNYGHRLDDVDSHKVSTSTVNNIKDDVKKTNGVTKVSYHQEGRVLNFTITLDGTVAVADAKKYAEEVTKGLSKKNLKYYDVQVFLNSKGDAEGYPTIGYHSKGSSEFSWGNAGEERE